MIKLTKPNGVQFLVRKDAIVRVDPDTTGYPTSAKCVIQINDLLMAIKETVVQLEGLINE